MAGNMSFKTTKKSERRKNTMTEEFRVGSLRRERGILMKEHLHREVKMTQRWRSGKSSFPGPTPLTDRVRPWLHLPSPGLPGGELLIIPQPARFKPSPGGTPQRVDEESPVALLAPRLENISEEEI